jgi:hypothetical protein
LLSLNSKGKENRKRKIPSILRIRNHRELSCSTQSGLLSRQEITGDIMVESGFPATRSAVQSWKGWKLVITHAICFPRG